MPTTSEQQYLLELVNTVRLDPVAGSKRLSALTGVAYATVLASVKGAATAQPLAWNDNLATISGGFLYSLNTRHMPPAANLTARALAAGYAGTVNNEFWSPTHIPLGNTTTSQPASAILEILNSSGAASTKNGIWNAKSSDFAIANAYDPFPPPGAGVTYNVVSEFGTGSTAGINILGVSYTDRNGNGCYNIGEGEANTLISLITIGNSVQT